MSQVQAENRDLLIRFNVSGALREAENAVDALHKMLLQSQIENAGLQKRIAVLEAEAEKIKSARETVLEPL